MQNLVRERGDLSRASRAEAERLKAEAHRRRQMVELARQRQAQARKRRRESFAVPGQWRETPRVDESTVVPPELDVVEVEDMPTVTIPLLQNEANMRALAMQRYPSMIVGTGRRYEGFVRPGRRR